MQTRTPLKQKALLERFCCDRAGVADGAVSHGSDLRRLIVANEPHIEFLHTVVLVVTDGVEPDRDGMTSTHVVSGLSNVLDKGTRFLQLNVVHSPVV